jgi:hypothetical protein
LTFDRSTYIHTRRALSVVQGAMTNCENMAAFGKTVAHLFSWHDPVTTRNFVLGLLASIVLHCIVPNR